ncbi:MAG: TetR/AcrR family transcriptional regulator [Candidatus Brocadiia bacterium]
MSELTRKQRERRRHRREVLEAAEKLFSRQGYHETTVQDIAREAEFGVGTLYNMFDNKAAIYYELVRLRAEQYMESTRQELRGMQGPVSKLRRLLRAKFEFFDSHRQFFTIFSRVLQENPGEGGLDLTDEGRKLYEEYTDLLTEIFRSGVESDDFVDVEPRLLTLSFEGTTRTVISDHLLRSGSSSFMSVIDDVERILLGGLLKDPERVNGVRHGNE